MATWKKTLLAQVQRGIVGDERDYDSLCRELDKLPELLSTEQAAGFVRMAERWATFYPDYIRPDWMTEAEFHRSIGV